MIAIYDSAMQGPRNGSNSRQKEASAVDANQWPVKFAGMLVVCLLGVTFVGQSVASENVQFTQEPKQRWNYTNVRPDAYMFWWLYYSTNSAGYSEVPLVMWLQGGPGSSSCGFGNFEEIGPLDVKLQPRQSSWVSRASVLFVDNPVGTGYSYVTNPSAYTTDVAMIAKDLLTTMKEFLKEVPEFKGRPFYIFSESYGGKMTAAFSQLLYKAVSAGEVSCDFRGLAMGDSWISPLDSVLTWAPYLYATSLVDVKGYEKVKSVADKCAVAYNAGDYGQSTRLWGETEGAISDTTGGVNLYNILKWNSSPMKSSEAKHASFKHKYLATLYENHVSRTQESELTRLMNGPIRKKLKIIPGNVTWGGQSGEVFQKQSTDFMKPVVDIVGDLLTNTDLRVVVYNGQLDLIVDTLGTMAWVQKLKWEGLREYNSSTREIIKSKTTRIPLAYLKKYKNFSFYWILDAGHMVPSDNSEAALTMLDMVIGK